MAPCTLPLCAHLILKVQDVVLIGGGWGALKKPGGYAKVRKIIHMKSHNFNH